MRAAIDFGISNTDAVAGIGGELHRWTRPSKGQSDPELVRAVLAAGGVELSSLQFLVVTGGRHRLLPSQIDDCVVISVNEVQAIGRGGQTLAGLSGEDEAVPILVVSAGSYGSGGGTERSICPRHRHRGHRRYFPWPRIQYERRGSASLVEGTR